MQFYALGCKLSKLKYFNKRNLSIKIFLQFDCIARQINLTNILNILTPYNLGVQPLYQTLLSIFSLRVIVFIDTTL